MITTKNALCAILCCLSLAACRQSAKDLPAEADQPAAEAGPDSWIGVQLAVRTSSADEIRDIEIEVAGVFPKMPADGFLKEGDILLKVGAGPVTDIDKTVDIIKKWPAGKALEVVFRRGVWEKNVFLIPEPRPSDTELLRRVYAGQTLSPLGGIMISTAAADGRGGIVPDSQCVMEGNKTCPKLGRLGKTDLAVGKVTVLLFWTQLGVAEGAPARTAAAFALLKQWQERFGAQGLEIVAITSDSPRSLASYLKTVGPQPRMTLVSMWLGNYGSARLASGLAPCVLVLDEKGVVRAAAGTIADLGALTDQVLPELLGVQRQ